MRKERAFSSSRSLMEERRRMKRRERPRRERDQDSAAGPRRVSYTDVVRLGAPEEVGALTWDLCDGGSGMASACLCQRKAWSCYEERVTLFSQKKSNYSDKRLSLCVCVCV
jgi:hypothetical protein